MSHIAEKASDEKCASAARRGQGAEAVAAAGDERRGRVFFT